MPGSVADADVVAGAADVHATANTDVSTDANAADKPITHAVPHRDGIPATADVWRAPYGDIYSNPHGDERVFAVADTYGHRPVFPAAAAIGE